MDEKLKLNEDKLMKILFEPDKYMKDAIEKLQDDFNILIAPKLEELKALKEKSKKQDKVIEGYDGFLESITPVQVYKCSFRRSTTVKFLDGSSVTVHRMKGDKDCLETAIVYALFKKVYPKKLLVNLVKNTVKVRKSRCKKG